MTYQHLLTAGKCFKYARNVAPDGWLTSKRSILDTVPTDRAQSGEFEVPNPLHPAIKSSTPIVRTGDLSVHKISA